MSIRTIVSRHSGSQHGFIRRMVSPGDLGARLTAETDARVLVAVDGGAGGGEY